jgi:hypothetical protein
MNYFLQLSVKGKIGFIVKLIFLTSPKSRLTSLDLCEKLTCLALGPNAQFEKRSREQTQQQKVGVSY